VTRTLRCARAARSDPAGRLEAAAVELRYPSIEQAKYLSHELFRTVGLSVRQLLPDLTKNCRLGAMRRYELFKLVNRCSKPYSVCHQLLSACRQSEISIALAGGGHSSALDLRREAGLAERMHIALESFAESQVPFGVIRKLWSAVLTS
jgi:hypothetical protein